MLRLRLCGSGVFSRSAFHGRKMGRMAPDTLPDVLVDPLGRCVLLRLTGGQVAVLPVRQLSLALADETGNGYVRSRHAP